MRCYRFMTVAVVAALLVACGTIRVGGDFDPKTFETRVQRGATTQAQVREWLGAPNGSGVTVQTDGERYDEWTYYYGEGHISGGDARLKMLQIKFDKSGTVRGYNWSGGK
ncbi:MAG: hypothetical protein HY083_06670 [Gammaproteobacteria bacterium]|nr:hypothetical protein [Gammaproteobacteria bacterium]